jgi:hypothetical protein
MGKVRCPHCDKKCTSPKGLDQHIKSSSFCQSRRGALNIAETDNLDGGTQKRKAEEDPALLDRKPAAKKRRTEADSEPGFFAGDRQTVAEPADSDLEPEQAVALEEGKQNPHFTGDEPWFDPNAEFDPYESESDRSSDDSDDPGPDVGDEASMGRNQDEVEEEAEFQASKACIRQFKDYVRNAYQNFDHLEEKEKVAARLMCSLLKKKASLDTYEAVMEWHLNTCGKL